MTEIEYEQVKKRELAAISFSLGELRQFLDTPDITDIWVDTTGCVSVRHFGRPREKTGIMLSIQQVKNIILQIAKIMDININYQTYPVLEGTVPSYNARITGIIGTWTSAPILTIRKPSTKIYTIDDYVTQGSLTADQAYLVKDCIRNKKNLIISGGTGTGKTTFAKACLKEMTDDFPSESFFIVEDNAELQCESEFATFIKIDTEQANSAIKLAMRYSPDHIIFGEIRTGIVLWALLDGWNTGHPGGLSTIHSSSAEGTFMRMRMLLSQEFVTIPPVNRMIDLVVHMSRRPGGVICDEIISTKDYSDSEIEELAKKSIEQGL